MPGCDAKGPKLIDSYGEKEARSGAGLALWPLKSITDGAEPQPVRSRALPLT